jgi:hypothetical protein
MPGRIHYASSDRNGNQIIHKCPHLQIAKLVASGARNIETYKVKFHAV